MLLCPLSFQVLTTAAAHGPTSGRGRWWTWNRPAGRRPIVGPAQAQLEHVAQRDWERSPRLVRAVTRDGIWLVVEWLDGEISQCGFWSFDPLPAIWNGSAQTRVRRVDGGACVAWLSEDGSDAFRIHSAELWAARE